MSDRKLLPGKFVWFEHASKDAKKAQAFYGEVLGWKVKPFPMGAALDRHRFGRGCRCGREGCDRERR